jgi:hypothetical protein
LLFLSEKIRKNLRKILKNIVGIKIGRISTATFAVFKRKNKKKLKKNLKKHRRYKNRPDKYSSFMTQSTGHLNGNSRTARVRLQIKLIRAIRS